MATVTPIVKRVRRLAGDYPVRDQLITTINNSTTVFQVNEGGDWAVGDIVTMDGEDMYVRAVAGTGLNTLTVARGWNGTTTATHSTSATSDILQNAKASGQDVMDGLNEGLRNLWPYFFKQSISDGTLQVTANAQSDYAMPAPFSNNQSRILRVQLLPSGGANDEWKEYRRFETIRGAGGVTLHFTGAAPEVGSKIRVIGLIPFSTDMTFAADLQDVELPDRAIPALVMYAVHYLLLQFESKRLEIRGAQNIGPAAVAAGANLTLSGVWLQKFRDYCQSNGQPWPQFSTRRRF
jgi:hypothetical protein